MIRQVCGRSDIPVYAGCDLPIVSDNGGKTWLSQIDFHGVDGLGGVACQEQEQEPQHQPQQHASEYLVDLVRSKPKEVVLIALGPLTNLALAQRLNSNFSSNIKWVSCENDLISNSTLAAGISCRNYSITCLLCLSVCHG
jgi:purine nucleosidase